MLKHNILNKITAIYIWAPKSKVRQKAHKMAMTVQPNISISDILKIYRFHRENNVRNLKINLTELCEC
jgi:hypothetical protein